MARGVRSNATLLPMFSPNLQPQSLSSYDPATRRNTILIAEIVPTLNLGDTERGMFYPADRYYALVGAALGTSALPGWTGAASGAVTFQNYDATNLQYYTRIGDGGTAILDSAGEYPIIWRGGAFGTATAHAPKNAGVTACWLRARMRFPTNADYGVYGMGATTAINNFFSSATDHFIQVTRNGGDWELGSCDGSTISQAASAGGADGSFHDFWVRWADGELRLYVDEAIVITKTTNLPGQPLKAVSGVSLDGSNPVDIVDYLIEWDQA